MSGLQEREIHQQRITLYTPDSLPSELLQQKPLILEVAAGDSPIGIGLARKQRNALVVSQDINPPKRLPEEIYPNNFYYVVGELTTLNLSLVSAVIAMFPFPHAPNTIPWLSGLINRALTENPSAYIGVVSETYAGNKLPQRLANTLTDMGWEPTIEHVDMNYVAHAFGKTTDGETIRLFTSEASLIEVNRDFRKKIING